MLFTRSKPAAEKSLEKVSNIINKDTRTMSNCQLETGKCSVRITKKLLD